MNSEEIKLALKPMADFAPAVLRAAEIVAAAEAGEKSLAELAGKKAALENDINAMKGTLPGFQLRTDQERQKLNDVIAQTAQAQASAEPIKREIAGLQAALIKGKADLEAELRMYAQQIQVQKADLARQADDARVELANAEASFAQWKRGHGL